jgi:hypothetical protein
MAWFLKHLLPLTVVSLVLALLLLIASQSVIAHWFPAHSTAADWAAAIVIAAVVGPMFNHAWAMKRDIQQRRWSAQQRHLDRLRPILLADAKLTSDLSKTVHDSGHAWGLHSSDRSDERFWFPNVLTRDLEVHFMDYFRAREELRNDIAAQEKEMRTLIARVGDAFSVPDVLTHSDWPTGRLQVAYALVRRCMEKATPMRLQRLHGGGYEFEYGTGGSQTNSAEEPPSSLVAMVEAFEQFQPDDGFRRACRTLADRAAEIERKLLEASDEANRLAEVSQIRGLCRYLQ